MFGIHLNEHDFMGIFGYMGITRKRGLWGRGRHLVGEGLGGVTTSIRGAHMQKVLVATQSALFLCASGTFHQTV